MAHDQDDELDVGRVAAYWLTEADEAMTVAEHLIAKGDYSYALFFGHLVIEKLLKALYVLHQKKHAPPLHHLLRLADVAGLVVDEEVAAMLLTVTAFNIEARYPDFKRTFRQLCTPDYTAEQMEMIKELQKWLRSQMPSMSA